MDGAGHHAGACLGDALVGSPNSPSLPDLWRMALFREHLDEEDRSTFFRTCRSARTWLLQSWDEATLTVHLDCAPALLFRRVSNARQQLLTRGQRSTHVKLWAVEDDTLSQAYVVLTMLQGLLSPPAPANPAVSITQLTIDTWGDTSLTSGTQLLAHAVATHPHLQKLVLNALPCKLPAPSMLSALQHLHINACHESPEHMYSTLTPYLSQLTTLHLDHPEYPTDQPPWQQLLAQPCLHLRHLHLCSTLDNELLGLLLQHTPHVEQLRVHDVHLTSAQHAERTWPVKQLQLGEAHRVVGSLHWMPSTTSSAGLTVEADGCQLAVATQEGGILPPILERLNDWHLEGFSRVVLNPAATTPATAQPAALTAALHHLASLRPRYPWDIILGLNWDWTHELVQQLALTLPSLPAGLVTQLMIEELNDPLLTSFLQHPPAVESIKTWSIDLEQDHSGAVCPWERVVYCTWLGVRPLLHMPTPSSGTLIIEVVEDCRLDWTVGRDELELVERVVQRLATVEFVADVDYQGQQLPICIFCPEQLFPFLQPRFVQAWMGALRALRVNSVCVPTVRLSGWDYTEEVVEELAGLPEWPVQLELQGTWSRERSLYCQLPSVVPACYSRWRLHGMPQEQLLDVLIGVVGHRQESDELFIGVRESGSALSLPTGYLELLEPYLELLGIDGIVSLEYFTRSEEEE